MKILYLAADVNLSYFQSGGAGTHIRGTIDYLKKKNEVISIIGGDILYKDYAQKKNILAPPKKTLSKRLIPSFVKRIYNDSKRIYFNKLILSFAKNLIDPNDLPDIIYERSCYGYDVGLKLSRMYNIPYCLESDVLLLEFVAPTTSIIFNRLFYRIMESAKIKMASSIVVMSGESIKLMKQKWAVKHDMIFNKGLGIDLVNFSPNNELDIDLYYGITNKFVVGFVGIFQKYQNIYLLLDAAKNIQDKDSSISFMIIGNGVEMNNYKRYQKKHCINNVIFTGTVEKTKIGNYYNRINLGVIPGCASHMYPVKYIEFGALKIPTLVPDYQVFRDFFENESDFNLFTFKANSAEYLASKILHLKEIYPELRQKIKYTHQYMLENNSWEKCGIRLEEALVQTIKGKNEDFTRA